MKTKAGKIHNIKKMKIFILCVLIFLGGCGLAKPALTTEQSKNETQKAVEIIKSKPDWLFPADACPADVIPANEKEITYVKDDCKNDPAGCLEECRKEDGNACYSLAILIQDYDGMSQEYSESLFLRACKYGIISGCTNRAAGKMNMEKGNPASMKCAADTFEKTCAKDDPWGCTMYALALTYETGRERNLDEALKALSKACKYGEDDPACQQAAKIKEQILKIKEESGKKDVNSNAAKK